MPKMKTKSSAKKRFRVRPGGTVKRGQAVPRAPGGYRQARSGLQAPHPHQEVHEEQAPLAWCDERARDQYGRHRADAALRWPLTHC